MSEIDLSKHSTEDLQKALAAKTAEENRLRKQAKEDYENQKEVAIGKIMAEAINVNQVVGNFKALCHQIFEKHKEMLDEYGGIRSNSKGGFSLISKDGDYKVTRIRCTTPQWDERSEKGTQLIEDFLKDTVKKRDLDVFELLYSFLKKNEKGDLEYSKVMNLISNKHRFKDPRWVEGLNLLEESYSIQLRAFGYTFSTKNEAGKWDTINVNFSSI